MSDIHLIKLCVGIDSLEHLREYRAARKKAGHPSEHVTRMRPTRADELVNGGSIYWVIKGFVQARQTITAITPITGEDGIKRCKLELNPKVIETASIARRPFQGWRYFPADQVPPDITATSNADELIPDNLKEALAALGVN